ncbi:hypothetical protein E6C27_scaffold19G002230 [Cucumis melo var. makuwa]|uniref:Uncharacterized protein n=1 Tax=Cucumis melo var. makuwa TaxID=1194695 RepID=A0A5A7SLU0_CUCMM|nr:hypothetical protein E6C27_scaffold19G002230 [Cucumis melo var. makuwa]
MALLFSLEGSTELTLKFSASAADLVGDSFLSLGKGFPTTGPRDQAETVVIHRGLHVSDCTEYLYGSVCSKTLVWMWFMEFGRGRTQLMDLKVTVQYVVKHWSGCGSWSLDGEGHWDVTDVDSLVWTEGTRLICASFGSTRLICASFGSTRLLCRVGVQRGADRREAGRMREGHMDASGFLFASAMEMPPRRGARRGGRGGRGRGAGRVQPEV